MPVLASIHARFSTPGTTVFQPPELADGLVRRKLPAHGATAGPARTRARRLSVALRKRTGPGGGSTRSPSLYTGASAQLPHERPRHGPARSVGLRPHLPRCAPGRSDALLHRSPLAGCSGPASFPEGDVRPSPAHEQLPQQVAGLPGRAGSRPAHAGSAGGCRRGKCRVRLTSARAIAKIRVLLSVGL